MVSRDSSAGNGEPDKSNWKVSLARSARADQPGKHRWEKSAGTDQPGKDRCEKSAGTGQTDRLA
jgi:hypothetical protein